MYAVRSIGRASAEVQFTVFALPVFLQVLREFVSSSETWFLLQLLLESSSVASFSSESKQHGDTQWWEMSTASYTPSHRPDLSVLHQSNRAIPLIYVSEQDVHKSIKMAHKTYLYLSLYMVVMSTGAVMGDGFEDDMG